MYLDARSINRRSKTDVTMFSSTHFRILFASQYFPDKAWARDILCLRVKCKWNDRGCDWIGELGHAEVCNVLFSLFSCQSCIDKLTSTVKYSISFKQVIIKLLIFSDLIISCFKSHLAFGSLQSYFLSKACFIFAE